jgi:PLP dependent protein
MMSDESLLRSNMARLEEKISEACVRGGRARSDVLLNMVAKTQSIQKVQVVAEYCEQNGISLVWGENYLSEASVKYTEARGAASRLPRHFIGALQSNKVPSLLQECDVIESVGSLKSSKVFMKHWTSQLRCKGFYLQVNVSDDGAKSGFSSNELFNIVESLTEKQRSFLLGLFTITRWYDIVEDVRPDFVRMKDCHHKMEQILQRPLALSMGMSRDFDIAIEEGATLIRVGSSLFGER